MEQLLFVSSLTTDQNMSIAQTGEYAIYPHQIPLFVSLDDREEHLI
ncbi:MAG: hypothetical protein ACRD8Z_10930 [Nitrososphaeraceae archaeon]